MRTFLFTLVLTVSSNSLAKDDLAPQKKADLLFHLLNYISWPKTSEAKQSLNWCAIVDSEQSEIHILSQRFPILIGDHTVDFHFFDNIANAVEFDREKNCHLSYFDELYSTLNIKPFILLSNNKTMLTIGSGESFIKKGGMLSLDIETPRKPYLLRSDKTNQDLDHLVNIQQPFVNISRKVYKDN